MQPNIHLLLYLTFGFQSFIGIELKGLLMQLKRLQLNQLMVAQKFSRLLGECHSYVSSYNWTSDHMIFIRNFSFLQTCNAQQTVGTFAQAAEMSQKSFYVHKTRTASWHYKLG